MSLLAGSSAVAAQTNPPGFTASPFSSEFVIVGTQEGVGVQYVPANGDGTFGAPTDVPGLSWVLDAYDADGDGDHDLMIHSSASQILYFVENEGGALAAPVIAAMVAGPGIAVGAPPLPGQ